MNVHAYFIAALLLIAVVFAEPDQSHSENCDEWTNKIGAVASAWTASQICPDPIWNRDADLTAAISIGSAIGLYPIEIVSKPSCLTYVEDTVRRNVRAFKNDARSCERFKSWMVIKEMRDKLLMLGLIKVD